MHGKLTARNVNKFKQISHLGTNYKFSLWFRYPKENELIEFKRLYKHAS